MKRASSEENSRVVFLHSSNEMYGADKILVEVLRSLPDDVRAQAEVWLPDDLPPTDRQLSDQLNRLGVANKRQSLPVLRRRYLSVRGITPLAMRLWKTYRSLRRLRPDVVYCTTSAMAICLPLAKFSGVKSTALHLQEIWAPREANVLGLMARFADTIICISSAARNSIPRGLHTRSVLLRNAHRGSNAPLVPLDRLSGPLKFLIASRWNSWKGHASLLGAWDQDESPGQLIILGGPPSVGEGVDVEAIVQDLRHSGSISIVGQVEDISGYIDEVDFLVLPSDKPEPFGLVILEAFARGRPVIASRGGGVLDVVVEGSNGLLFDMGEPSQLHELIHNADRTLAASLGRQARRDFEENFSIESYESSIQNIWPELVRRG